MLKKRLIPTLLLQNGQLVKSVGFNEYQIIGNPKTAIQFFNAWAVDEIIFLDISKDRNYLDLMRDDYNYKSPDNFLGIVEECAKICFVPLTVGGGIRSTDDMVAYFKHGADKISINTEAVKNPKIITEGALKFGKQAIVVSVDVKFISGKYEVFINHGLEATGLDPIEWIKTVEKMGAGEILINSIDRDGSLIGYDLNLIKNITDNVGIPVIALGGVGKWQDLVDGVKLGGASAVSAANIFHYTEQSTRQAKKHMVEIGLDVRI
ncbi:MAG: imidazole glycerol phosphate synthase cyclase subunit [Patescibacteria group bacterium]